MTLLPPPATTAFVIVDMQNDFVHPDGAYGRTGKTAAAIAALPARHRKLSRAMRAAGGWIVSTHFTLVPGRDGEPFMSPHLKNLRPFLGRGDFAPGSFGHELIADLQPSDLQVEKVAFSAFYQSRMEWMLARAGIRTLIFGGIVTNGGVASTVRDAHVRDFHTIVLADGCAAFSQSAHEASIAALATISEIATVEEMVAALGG
ncbi:MAG: cysteine hydrolase [Pseudomonadota bacterium]|nr:cysteine hydrolase [Pseudomonadota bacterium]MED5518241.1 cysteine hydrolase [Pseudomonadota bacterium]